MRWFGGALSAIALAIGLQAIFVTVFWPHAHPPAPRMITRAPSHPGEATVMFAGDTAQVDAGLETFQERGLEWSFGSTLDLISAPDLTVVNLEGPITDGGDRYPLWQKFVYRAPSRSAEVLAWAGIDVVNLANNHARDYGASGLSDTLALTSRAGLVSFGAGANEDEARRGLIAQIGEARVGFLGYLEDQIEWRFYSDLFARAHHPGIARLTDSALAEDIARLRPLVDVLVVSFHIGTNYTPPKKSTIAWSERAVELGADLVIDHHPHVAHPLMVHLGRPIALSLGNFAFATEGHEELDYGWLLTAHISGRALDRVEMVPLSVQNRRVRFRPEPLVGEERGRVLAAFASASAEYGAKLKVEADRVVWTR